MIKNLTVFFLGLVFSFAASAETIEIEFSINCKILDQVILEVNDGKSVRYNGYTDGPKIGDHVDFEVKFSSIGKLYSLSVKFTEDRLLYATMSDLQFHKKLESGVMWKDGDHVQTLLNDYMYLGGHSRLRGTRYYKNDWNMIFTSSTDRTDSFTRTMNCLNVPENYNVILKKVNDIHSTPSKAP